MALKVVPSDVVSFMEAQTDLPILAPANSGKGPVSVERNHLAVVASVLRLADSVPTELLTLSGSELAGYVAAVEQVRVAVGVWQADHRSAYKLGNSPRRQGEPHPLKVIQDALRQCPDDTGLAEGTAFEFLAHEPDLQADFDRDLLSVTQAILRRDWNAAAVIGVALVEALVLGVGE